jgi:hypothetical protein
MNWFIFFLGMLTGLVLPLVTGWLIRLYEPATPRMNLEELITEARSLPRHVKDPETDK